MNRTVEQVMSGELFTALLLDDPDQRVSALEAVLGKVVDDDTRVAWVGNPLRSPLTMERFLLQVLGPEIDLLIERGSEELARIIAKPVGHESRLLIVVQQPETINAEMRDLLVEMAGHLDGESVQVQFLFSGPSAFAVPQRPTPDITALSSPGQAADPTDVEGEPPSRRRRDVLPLLVLLFTLTIGVVISIAPVSPDDLPGIGAAIAPTIHSTPARRSPDPPSKLSLLRREFDAFLAHHHPPLPPMTDAEKSALFGDFLTHRHRE